MNSSSNNISHSENDYIALTEEQVSILIRNGNYAENWNSIKVAKGFNAALVINCRFYGNIHIGFLNEGDREHSGLILPVGLCQSTFRNCTIGSNVVVNQLGFCSNYVIGNESFIHNAGQITTGQNASFGNGAAALDENRNGIKWIHITNENGGRKIVPFDGMICADAFIWSKFRDDEKLMDCLLEITKNFSSSQVKCPGVIGSAAVIKNVRTISDSNIGDFAIIDGAEAIISTTIKSEDLEKSIVTYGVILKNCIIGFGNEIESGTQLSDTVTGANVSISHTARISHSFIGDNSAISCCEIANSLIFPSHAQHHNNSFLIAANIGGQSNIAAGATIGSNHNSRVNDGELWASRGFWPGLCTSFKHNSRFASYTMCVKGDYPSELDIRFPFSLIANDTAQDTLLIYPAFWFTNNMYALMRSRLKFASRDKRIHKNQIIEHDPFAPDTIEEIFTSIELLEELAGHKWYIENGFQESSPEECRTKGKALFDKGSDFISELPVKPNTFERGHRKVVLKNCTHAWNFYHNMILWYSVNTVLEHRDLETLWKGLPIMSHESKWINAGGQIWPHCDMQELLGKIKSGKLTNWNQVHDEYYYYFERYKELKVGHAVSSLAEYEGVSGDIFTRDDFRNAFVNSLPVINRICGLTRSSRAKDYSDQFRKIVYDSDKEMNLVTGSIEEDRVIQSVESEAEKIKSKISDFLSLFNGR
jgi:hypothetical protein